MDGLRDSVLAFSKKVQHQSQGHHGHGTGHPVVQYFDTMKEIGATSKSSSVFIPHGPGAVKDVVAQIRDGLLQANLQ